MGCSVALAMILVQIGCAARPEVDKFSSLAQETSASAAEAQSETGKSNKSNFSDADVAEMVSAIQAQSLEVGSGQGVHAVPPVHTPKLSVTQDVVTVVAAPIASKAQGTEHEMYTSAAENAKSKDEDENISDDRHLVTRPRNASVAKPIGESHEAQMQPELPHLMPGLTPVLPISSSKGSAPKRSNLSDAAPHSNGTDPQFSGGSSHHADKIEKVHVVHSVPEPPTKQYHSSGIRWMLVFPVLLTLWMVSIIALVIYSTCLCFAPKRSGSETKATSKAHSAAYSRQDSRYAY